MSRFLRISRPHVLQRKQRKGVPGTMNNYDKVANFLTVGRVPRGELAAMDPEKSFRSLRLIIEELDELREALTAFNKKPSLDTLAEVADALIDIEYVVNNMHYDLGLPAMQLFDCVHDSNMAKFTVCGSCAGLGGDGLHTCNMCGDTGLLVIKDENGKIRKPEGWQRPELHPILYAEYKRSYERIKNKK